MVPRIKIRYFWSEIGILSSKSKLNNLIIYKFYNKWICFKICVNDILHLFVNYLCLSIITTHSLPLTKIPDKLWNMISIILPTEKLNNAVGHPIIPHRKVMDGIVYIFRTGCQLKMLSKEYCSGSICHKWFQEWIHLDIFKKIWIKLLNIYDNRKDIKWM